MKKLNRNNKKVKKDEKSQKKVGKSWNKVDNFRLDYFVMEVDYENDNKLHKMVFDQKCQINRTIINLNLSLFEYNRAILIYNWSIFD